MMELKLPNNCVAGVPMMTLAFLTGFAVGTFVAGIVSDMFGRKRYDLFDFCKRKNLCGVTSYDQIKYK